MAFQNKRVGVRAGARFHAEPDWSVLVRELKRPGVNLLVLWDEYRAIHPEGYAYSRFCQLFREFERRLSPTMSGEPLGSMRQQHVAGHKAFVDYSGKRVPITDPLTGEVRMAEPRAGAGRELRPAPVSIRSVFRPFQAGVTPAMGEHQHAPGQARGCSALPPRPKPPPCCSGPCWPRVRSPCARSTDGRPWPKR